MKKKILFIISNMESGGVSKSMSSLLNVIDTTKYEVDCFITSPTGIFMDTIPASVKILTDKKTTLAFSSFPSNIVKLVTHGFWMTACLRVVAACLMLINKGYGGWVLSKILPEIPTKYDLAVDYNGQHQLYYLIDTIHAKKKVTFFHSDYAKWSHYLSMDRKYMPKADFIYTISNQCVISLKKYFPNQSTKIALFENISAAETIVRMSTVPVEDNLNPSFVKLLTIGHVSEAKGSDLAIKAARILQNNGLQFKWYFIGKKSDNPLFSKLIKENTLENSIVLMGLKSNPYPYIKQADVIVHPSLFEGKSIALDEAKILCKPIVVTNFSTVHDQFTDRDNASICNMTAEDVAKSILELLENESLRNKYIANLKVNQKDNTAEIEKLYKFLID